MRLAAGLRPDPLGIRSVALPRLPSVIRGGEGGKGEERFENTEGRKGREIGREGAGRDGKGEGVSGRGREGMARLGYLSRAPEFLVTPLATAAIPYVNMALRCTRANIRATLCDCCYSAHTHLIGE